jgi:hypothetical protein
MNSLRTLLELLNQVSDPTTSKSLQQYKMQLLRLFPLIFGRRARIAIAITLLLVIIDSGGQRKSNITLPRPQTTNEITWELPDGSIIPMGKIATTHYIDGVELVEDSSMVRLKTHNNNNQQGYHILNVPEKFNYKLVLPDGTIVQLNAASRLKIPADFGSKKRELFLEGEGFFDITPNPRQLLTIHCGQADILALGTSLNVNNYDNNVQVALATGSIIVSTKDKKRQLKPGQVIIIDSSTGQMEIDITKYISALAWLDGHYNTAGKSMEEVRSALERWYGVTIVFDDPDFSKNHFGSAFFRNQPLDSFLHRLKTAGYLESYELEKDGKLHLK